MAFVTSAADRERDGWTLVSEKDDKKKKRQWSQDFTPRNPVQINIAHVPSTLRAKFQAKCRREQKSQRNLLLGWIRNWVDGREPGDDGKPLPDAQHTEDVARAS